MPLSQGSHGGGIDSNRLECGGRRAADSRFATRRAPAVTMRGALLAQSTRSVSVIASGVDR